MINDLPTLFRAAHAAIGDEIVPEGFGRDEFICYLTVTPNVAHSGIVHALRWLAANATCGEADFGLSAVGTIHRGEHQSQPHDNTPPSIYAALLRLATRVAQEKTQ